ncbi:uncharacterized protein [Physcomitrium patens]|uniref:uncharacterized protein n=1 Tax=Physcomitrium patens TaxID=3218 RepID=UPI003CCDECE0
MECVSSNNGPQHRVNKNPPTLRWVSGFAQSSRYSRCRDPQLELSEVAAEDGVQQWHPLTMQILEGRVPPCCNLSRPLQSVHVGGVREFVACPGSVGLSLLRSAFCCDTTVGPQPTIQVSWTRTRSLIY